MKWTVRFVVIPFCVLGGWIQAQEGMPYRLQSGIIGNAGCAFDYWKVKKDKVSEFTIPMMMVRPFSSKLTMYALTSPAFSSLNTGESYGLSGLSDIKIGGHYLILNDQWLLTFGLNLPSGKSALKTEEYTVATVLTIPAFNFRTPSLGQGMDVQAGLSGARELGGFVLGYGVNYLLKGAYKPFDDVEDTYNPGDELGFSLGAERRVQWLGKDMRLTGDVLYSMYFSDTWLKERVFKSGNRLLIQFMSVFKQGPLDLVLMARDRIKGKNKTGSYEAFETERKNSNGNQFEMLGIGTWPRGPDTRLKGILEFKLYSDSDYGTGGATLFGLGGGARRKLTPKMDFDGDVRLYFGSLKTSVEKAGVLGIKFYGGIVYHF